ncbi:MAG: Crp/Fnr family transcriptional regulator [Bauldia sp.]|nr:Crp/Fnr family transcriptional regulator [Bauldia sp.]
MIDPEAVMAGAGWLSGQPPEFRRRVIELAKLRHFEAGERVCEAGDPPGDLYGLVEGELTVHIAPDDIAPLMVHIAQPGWWMGEAALMTRTPRRVSMTARRPSWLLCLGPEAIGRMAAEDPETWRRLAHITVSHLDHALGTIATLTATDPRIRVAVALRRVIGLADGLPSSAVVDLSQEELGELARLTRNALRPVLVDFERRGLIRRSYRRIEIPDVDALVRFARKIAADPVPLR